MTFFKGVLFVQIRAEMNYLIRIAPAQNHGLNMELDLQSLFGLLCTAGLIG